jgi:hypothetical protein
MTGTCSFVKVHFTVSPAARLNVAVRLARLPVEFASSHARLVRWKPVEAASVEV